MKIMKILLLCLISVNIYSMSNEQWRDKYLNNEEKQWIKDNPVITYIEFDWEPVAIIKNNKLTGIMGEYLDLVSERLGIKTKFIPSSSWLSGFEKFKQGKADLIPGVSEAHNIGYLSNPYVSYPMVAVTSDNSISYITNLEEVKDKIFSVPKNWASWYFIKKKLPNAKIIETETLEEAILNVVQHKADIVIAHKAVATYNIATIAPSLKITGKLDFTYRHHFMVHEENKLFISMANKIFDSIDEKDKIEIYSHWAYAQVKQDIDYAMVVKIILSIIFIFMVIIFYSIKLKNALRAIKKQQNTLNESIEYASTVQLVLMSNNHTFDDYFGKSFTIWEPKDKVGGDIYLSRKISDDEILVYMIDCIGHGIPGALLTVYVKAIEQQVLPHFRILNEPLSTNKILDFFHEKMVELYNKDISAKQALCFDGAVFYYNKKSKAVKFSGANTPIFYIQNNKIEVIKTNRRTIGISSKRDKDFIEHSMNIDTDTFFYITTDGLIDQIGGEKKLPLGKEKLKIQLLKDYKKSGIIQKENIIEMLISYQQDSPRLDDVTLVGFEIKNDE